jgi:hypothetical protein
MIAVFFGSRSWDDLEGVEEIFDRLILEGDGSLVVVTGANGVPRGRSATPAPRPPERSADALADWVALRRGLLPIRVHADWTGPCDFEGEVRCRPGHRRRRSDGTEFCPAAGNRRNQRIIDEHLWQFEGEEQLAAVGFKRTDAPSPGTDDMRERIRPFVERGTVQGIFRTSAGPAHADRRVPRPLFVPRVSADPFPEAV